MKMTKTYDVSFQGRVDYTARVEANDPSDAMEKARELRDQINLKSEIYVNGWFNDECEEDVEEIDVVAEDANKAKWTYLQVKKEELGEEEFRKNWKEIIKEYDAILKIKGGP
jgi:hypothetical protein